MTTLKRHQQMVFDDRYRYNGEDVEGLRVRMSFAAASVEKDSFVWYSNFMSMLNDFLVIPGGRIMYAAGTNIKIPFFNCSVIPSPEDSRKGIMRNLELMLELMAHGCGVGVDLSTLRYKGSLVKGVNGKSSGVVSWADMYSTLTATVEQGGSRRGALMLGLRINHPDILDFIHAKDSPGKLTQANLSILLTNDFKEALKNDAPWDLVWNGEVIETVSAKFLWDEICKTAWLTGGPGLLFIDRYNEMNNTGYFETIIMTNPCGELGLPANGFCPLININLNSDRIKTFLDLSEAVADTVRFIDNMLDVSPYLSEESERVVKMSRRVGLGTMGLADLLLKKQIRYGSEEALLYVDALYEAIKIAAYRASVEIAKEKGSFPMFNADEFLNRPFIKTLPADLREDIRRYGIRNASLLTLAPTGSSGLFADASSGIEPIMAWHELRKDNLGTYTINHWLTELFPDGKYPAYAVTAHEVSAMEHIKMLTTIQKHIDSSISKTINMPKSATVEDVAAAYMYAWDHGAKGCTVYRDGSIEDQVRSVIKTDTDVCPEPPQKVWRKKAADTIYFPKKIHTGCGKLMLFVGYSPSEKTVQDFYVKRIGQGGCERLIDNTIIAMSGMLRWGGNLESIKKAFSNVGPCSSFTRKRTLGGKLSSGNNCGDAIMRTVLQFMEENDCATQAPVLEARGSGVSPAAIGFDLCPGCNKTIRQLGCKTCPECGYSEC